MRRPPPCRAPALLACLALVATAGASERVAEVLNRGTETFETAMQRHFAPVGRRLLDFRTRYRLEQAAKIAAALRTGSEADRRYLAYHLLTVFPRHREAIAVWGKDPAGRPVALDGSRNPAVAVPQPDDPALRELVRHFDQPPFALVREEVVKAWRSFNTRTKQRTEATFYAGLRRLCSLAPAQAKPVMAFYFPTAKEARGVPRPATPWLNPLDRFLLDEGMSAVECDRTAPTRGPKPTVDERTIRFDGDATYDFPLLLANCRLEALVDAGSVLAVDLLARGSRSVSLAWRAGAGAVTVDGRRTDLSLPAGVAGGRLELELRARRLVASIDGLLLAEVEVGTPPALTGVRVGRGSVAPHLAIRYLGAPAAGAETATPPPPMEAAWKRTLDAALGKPLTVAFEDQQLGAVVESLAAAAGVAFVVDESASALMDVPLTFAAEDMRLADLLTWIGRMTQVDHRLTEAGIVLEWRAAR